MRLIGLAALAWAAGATVVQADDAGSVPTAASADQAVTAYPAAYFASQNANTAWDMVNRIPGFTFEGGDNVRGFAGAAGNVLIDGQRPTSKSDSLQDMLKRIPAGQVERVEVIRGGAPGVDMHGKAMIANVVRKSGGAFRGTIVAVDLQQSDGRNNPQLRLDGTGKVGNYRYEADLLVANFVDGGVNDGPHEVRDAAATLRNRSDMHNRGGGVQAVLTGSLETPVMGGTFKVNGMLKDQPYHADLHDNFPGTFVFSGPQDEHDRQNQADGELGLHYERPLGPKASVELIGLQHLSKVHISSLFANSSETDDFQLRDTGGESIARGVLHYTPSASLGLEGGGEFAYNWVNTRTSFSQNGTAIPLPAANVKVTEKRAEAFLTATWRPSPKLTVEAGARFEASQIASTGDVVLSNTFSFPKPRVLLTWSPTATDQVRIRLEHEVGQLDFNNFVASSSLNSSGAAILTGNPNLTPQQSWVAEAAFEHHFGKSGDVVLTARRLKITDVIDRAPDPTGAFDAPHNIGSGTETDLIGSFSLPLTALIPHGELKGIATFRDSRVTDPTTGRTRAISGQHPVDAEMHFVQDFPARKASWGVDVFSVFAEHYYRFNEIDTFRVSRPWFTLFAEYKARPDLAFRVMVDNLTNQPFVIERDVFAGSRASHPAPDFTDRQARIYGRLLYIRVRKTF